MLSLLNISSLPAVAAGDQRTRVPVAVQVAIPLA
jgi:hypothetical protein